MKILNQTFNLSSEQAYDIRVELGQLRELVYKQGDFKDDNDEKNISFRELIFNVNIASGWMRKDIKDWDVIFLIKQNGVRYPFQFKFTNSTSLEISIQKVNSDWVSLNLSKEDEKICIQIVKSFKCDAPSQEIKEILNYFIEGLEPSLKFTMSKFIKENRMFFSNKELEALPTSLLNFVQKFPAAEKAPDISKSNCILL